jgi:hypothetical protein
MFTERQIRRGTHRSTVGLENAIRSYLALNNRDPKPFVWTKTADHILESIKRFCSEQLPAKDATERVHREEEAGVLRMDPALMIGGQTASRDDAVHVRMAASFMSRSGDDLAQP